MNSQTIHCPHCSTEYAFVELSANTMIRCSQCIMDFQASDHKVSSVSNSKSIWSLILGFSSIMCLLFTGIPAVILGLRALRQNRQSKKRVKNNWMNYTGIATGTVFGIGGGALALMVIYAIALFSLTATNERDDQEKIDAGVAKVIEIDLPSDLRFKSLNHAMGVIAANGEIENELTEEEREKGFDGATSIRMMSFPKWLPVSSAQMLQNFQNAARSYQRGNTETSQETIQCEIFGVESWIQFIAVKPVQESDQNDDVESKTIIRQYACAVETRNGLMAFWVRVYDRFAARHEQGGRAVSHEEAINIIKSLKLSN